MLVSAATEANRNGDGGKAVLFITAAQPASGTRKVTWATPLRQYVGCSEWFLSTLRALAPESDLRIIYWFND